MILNWIGIVVALLFGAWAIWIAISAEKYDKKMHVPGKLCSWTHIEIMAGYYTAVTVLSGLALAILAINVIAICSRLATKRSDLQAN